ncbi:MAG TPA: MFS transporter [Gemmata sp.]|nr:MFS transporter [Gemmata sp.]
MSDDAARLRRWQTITIATLFTGYAGYYVCRSNLSVATPLLLDEYGSRGLTKRHIGDIASVGLLLYAVGKVLNGLSTEYLGGRRMFLMGLFASVVCTVLFALSPLLEESFADLATWFGLPLAVLLPFYIIWGINRFAQSMGWGGLVQIASRWFTPARMATVMGVLSMSYLLGDAAARLFLGEVIGAGFGWRGVFLASAIILGVIGLVALFTLRNRPGDLGLPEPLPHPENVYGADKGHERPALRSLLWPLLTSSAFWLVCLMNAGLTLIREAFGLWNPTYLHEVAKLHSDHAAEASFVFPLSGAVSALVAGWLVDRGGGRYGVVVIPSLLSLLAVLGMLAWLPLEGNAWLAVTLIGAAGFFLLAPYTFCAGVLAVKIGGQRAGATASGLIDTAGYLGALLAGSGIGRLAESYGWGSVFLSLAAVAGATFLIALVFTFRGQSFSGLRARESATPQKPHREDSVTE